MAQWQVGTAMVQRIFSHKQRNSYGAYGIHITGTAKQQRQNGNGMVETRHNCYLCLCNEGAGSHEIKSGDANDTFWIIDSLKLQHFTGNWNS